MCHSVLSSRDAGRLPTAITPLCREMPGRKEAKCRHMRQITLVCLGFILSSVYLVGARAEQFILLRIV